MNAQPITFHNDQSSSRGPCFMRAGERVSIEDALREGFVIRPDDTPLVCTLIVNAIRAREELHN
jgi:hypothetical protein